MEFWLYHRLRPSRLAPLVSGLGDTLEADGLEQEYLERRLLALLWLHLSAVPLQLALRPCRVPDGLGWQSRGVPGGHHHKEGRR
jgi:hypothetical protein